jgi:hypothetical protein
MNKLDRCDACGAEAQCRVESPTTGNFLDLCGHHFRKYAPAIGEWYVVDGGGA